MSLVTTERFENFIDWNAKAEFERFVIKVDERTEYQYGLRDHYEAPKDDPALGPNVEYFSRLITADDRMRYIMENIVGLPDTVVSPRNKICNTIISHFYGARGIHTLVTGEANPKLAHFDFERVAAGDLGYVQDTKRVVKAYHALGKKFYGTTELHTSLQTAARNFCREKYDNPTKPAELTDILEWISGWVADGTIDRILNDTTSLRGMFTLLKTKPGVGEYYAYHCATSNSVNPALPFHNDERFCAPGPGARATLDYIFSKLKEKRNGKMPYGELIIWVRENQKELFGDLKVHPFFHNFLYDGGKKIFDHEQDEFKTYGTEVCHCQFGVYRHLKANPHLISKRIVVREEDDSTCDGALLDKLGLKDDLINKLLKF
jgi:hypothetical protein